MTYVENEKTRSCTKCKHDLPTSSFNKMSSAKDGMQRYCRECQKAKFSEYCANPDSIKKMRERSAEYREENKDLIVRRRWERYHLTDYGDVLRQRSAEYGRKNRDIISTRMAEYRIENREKISESRRAYRRENSEYISVYDREYRKKNRPKIRQINAKRRFRRKNAVPAWSDISAVNRFYEEADRLTLESGVEYQVDHIVPLVSDLVCGLHCEANLQVITKYENILKGNRYWPGMSGDLDLYGEPCSLYPSQGSSM